LTLKCHIRTSPLPIFQSLLTLSKIGLTCKSEQLLFYKILNPVCSLKAQYGKYHKQMSKTGQGLIDDGHEDEIAPNSEIATLWGMPSSLLFIYCISNILFLLQN
jgi:hypothetical protein